MTARGTAVDGSYDLDADGTPDVITDDGDRLHLYVQREGCLEAYGSVALQGRRAFVHVGPGQIVVETWLMHGDRRAVHYRYEDGNLVQVGQPRVLLGPRKRP